VFQWKEIVDVNHFGYVLVVMLLGGGGYYGRRRWF
jgi:hypothetical protein